MKKNVTLPLWGCMPEQNDQYGNYRSSYTVLVQIDDYCLCIIQKHTIGEIKILCIGVFTPCGTDRNTIKILNE